MVDKGTAKIKASNGNPAISALMEQFFNDMVVQFKKKAHVFISYGSQAGEYNSAVNVPLDI